MYGAFVGVLASSLSKGSVEHLLIKKKRKSMTSGFYCQAGTFDLYSRYYSEKKTVKFVIYVGVYVNGLAF